MSHFSPSPHGRIKDLPGYSYDDVDYGTMLDVAKGRRFKGMQMVQPWTDADGNPVNPDKMMIQPLRARRDYGEIEGEIAMRMKEAKIASKIAAGSPTSGRIGRYFNTMLDASIALGKMREDAGALYLSLSQYQDDLSGTGTHYQDDVDGKPGKNRQQQMAAVEATMKKLAEGINTTIQAQKMIVQAGNAFVKASKNAEEIK